MSTMAYGASNWKLKQTRMINLKAAKSTAYFQKDKLYAILSTPHNGSAINTGA
jgi:hypothetical protein